MPPQNPLTEKILVVDGIARVHKELNTMHPELHLMQYGEDGKGMFAVCGYRGWVSAGQEGDVMCATCQKIIAAHGGVDALIDMEGLSLG